MRRQIVIFLRHLIERQPENERKTEKHGSFISSKIAKP